MTQTTSSTINFSNTLWTAASPFVFVATGPSSLTGSTLLPAINSTADP
jgi:hypothetical protein